MILFLSAQQPRLDSLVDQRFGRCMWLIQYDTDTQQWEAFENPGAKQSGGAGVAAAQFVVNHKANVVISGDFGPHAASAFQAAGIKMHLYGSDITTIERAISSHQQGKLAAFS